MAVESVGGGTSESPLDKAAEVPSCYVLMKISVDTFPDESPSEADMLALAKDLSKSWSGQVIVSRAIVTYEVTPVTSLTWVDEDDKK